MTRKVYAGEEICVSFDLDICQHSGVCTHGLPEVFNVDRRPWISPDEADADRVADIVNQCPSGALQYEWTDEPEAA